LWKKLRRYFPIFEGGGREPDSVVANFATTAADGNRAQHRKTAASPVREMPLHQNGFIYSAVCD